MVASDIEGRQQLTTVSGDTKELKHLKRNFNFWNLCGVGLMTGSTWPSLGGGISTSIYNGGVPGAIYELISVSVFYWMIAACIAELASSIPSSAGIYHFAAIASGPKHGRLASWYAGYFNGLAWIFGAASVSSVVATQVLALWQLWHPGYTEERWHLFVIYMMFLWLSCAIVLFGNRALPIMGDIGAAIIIVGFLIIVITCAVAPSRPEGDAYATHSFVWKDWVNMTGWENNGFVFAMGMLNGAYAVGTPDVCTHLAEEIPEPKKNIPRAIGIQMMVGFFTAICFLIAVFYTVHNPQGLWSPGNTLFPLIDVFIQATGTRAGATGLNIVMVAPGLFMSVGGFLTASRIVYTMARDKGTPFSKQLARVHPRWGNPAGSVICCTIIATATGFIYFGSDTAFHALVGSFVTLTTLSYLGAIFPYLVTKRKFVTHGDFRMPDFIFYPIATISCCYIAVFVVIFSFPSNMPVSAASMNYTSGIVGGISMVMAIYWTVKGRHEYTGPTEELLNHLQGIEPERNEEEVTPSKMEAEKSFM